MNTSERRWALVLAAGSGTRLSGLTRSADGTAIPKQYCSLDGERSLLEAAIERAARHVPRERIVVIVAREHERHWCALAAEIAPENWIVQPENKGTAVGILLPLLSIYTRDPDAHVLVLPADHHFTDEPGLAESLARGFEAIERSAPVLLLGMTPEWAETDYGWIQPGERSDARAPTGVTPVAAFVEKPPHDRAQALLDGGALWNSFLFLARARGLIGLYGRRMPYLLDSLRRALALGPEAVAEQYGRLEARDFSRDLLERAGRALEVLRAPSAGWTDLGTPTRVAACLARDPVAPRRERRASEPRVLFDLGLALRAGAMTALAS